jgi:hypothetical protein
MENKDLYHDYEEPRDFGLIPFSSKSPEEKAQYLERFRQLRQADKERLDLALSQMRDDIWDENNKYLFFE